MGLDFNSQWGDAFAASPYRLRFDLNQGGNYINMFSQSYERARALARAAISMDHPVAVIAANPDPLSDIAAKRSRRLWRGKHPFEILAEMGIPAVECLAVWTGLPLGHGPYIPPCASWEHRAVRLTWDQADILLWSNIGHEIGISPVAPVISTLVDTERLITAFAYDDRGMDITAINADAIVDLYDHFDAWLLDYDRPRMSMAFHRTP
jgi:Domain of unknown function (DUF3885)